MSQGHNHLNHATWECKCHVVFTPKYRKKLLFGQIRQPRLDGHIRSPEMILKLESRLQQSQTRTETCTLHVSF
jgi:REP element-mobilizing transposase RayT